MSPSERRGAIIDILCEKRFETAENLAVQLGVSKRTIYHDLLTLSCSYPILTIRGRHGGGVKLEDWYHPDRNLLSEPQEKLLLELRDTLSGEDRIIMNSILAQFALHRGVDT